MFLLEYIYFLDLFSYPTPTSRPLPEKVSSLDAISSYCVIFWWIIKEAFKLGFGGESPDEHPVPDIAEESGGDEAAGMLQTPQ